MMKLKEVLMFLAVLLDSSPAAARPPAQARRRPTASNATARTPGASNCKFHSDERKQCMLMPCERALTNGRGKPCEWCSVNYAYMTHLGLF